MNKNIEKKLERYEAINQRHKRAGHRSIDMYVEETVQIMEKAQAEKTESSIVEAIMYGYKCGVVDGYRARKAEEGKSNENH